MHIVKLARRLDLYISANKHRNIIAHLPKTWPSHSLRERRTFCGHDGNIRWNQPVATSGGVVVQLQIYVPFVRPRPVSPDRVMSAQVRI